MAKKKLKKAVDGLPLPKAKPLNPKDIVVPEGYDQAIQSILKKQLSGELTLPNLPTEAAHFKNEGLINLQDEEDPAKKRKGINPAFLDAGMQALQGLFTDPIHRPVAEPQMVYNDKALGTGSQAIYADGGQVGGDPKPTVGKKEYEAAKAAYYKALQDGGRDLQTNRADKTKMHNVLLDNMRFYEPGGYWTTEPVKDALFQVGNGIRAVGNHLLGTHFEDGGELADGGDPTKPAKVKPPTLVDKYGSYVKGRESWVKSVDQKLGQKTLREITTNAAKASKINPALLYASAMEEGVQLRLKDPNDASIAYDTQIAGAKGYDKQTNKFKSELYPVDGFYAYGLDTFGSQYDTLVKKGYLPKEFASQFTPYDAQNEKLQTVRTAAFANDEAAMQAKGAMMAYERDNFLNYAKKQKIALSPEAQDFFTLAAYNGGAGNAQKMLTSWNQAGYLKDNAFLTKKPKNYGGIYDNVMRRMQGAAMMHGEKIFADGGTLSDGGELQLGPEGAAKAISYNPYSGETIEFKGPSHEDGGIDMAFGGNQVEVEGDETAFKDAEGNLQIMGNMIVPGTKQKFKSVSKAIAKEEMKAQKQKTLAQQLMEDRSEHKPTDHLALNAGKLMAEGADLKQKKLAQRKELLAALQTSILQKADEMGVDPNDMLSGKKKARWGATVKAANGAKVPRTEIEALVEKIAKAKGVDAATVKRLIFQESGFNPKAKSNTGALGVMQMMPATAKQYGITPAMLSSEDPKDIEKVIEAGTQHYASLVKKYKGDNKLALAAYNGGGGAVKFVKKKLGKKSITGDEWVKFMEDRQKNTPTKKTSAWQTQTLDYVKTIAGTDDKTFYGDDKTPGAGTVYRQRYYSPDNITFDDKPALTTASDLTPITVTSTKKKSENAPVVQWNNKFDFSDKKEQQQKVPQTSNVEKLRVDQYLPELVAQARNTVDPVWMQQVTPEYYQPYQVSMQDQINENNAAFNGIQKQLDDPASLALLAAQKYGANSKVLADQFRTNQGIEGDIINRNTALFNDTQLKNLQLADQQYVRQQTAQSKTDAQNNEILTSIAAKGIQHDAQMQKLAAYENLYKYRFQDTDGDGYNDKAVNENPFPFFDFGVQGVPATGAPKVKNTEVVTLDANGRPIQTTRKKEDVIPGTKTTKKKNGGSVNSLYNQMMKKMR